MGGAKWPVLILINHRIEFPNQSKWMANTIRPLHSSYPKCFLQSSLSQYYIKLSMWFSPDPKMHHHHRSQGRVPLICSTFVYDVPVYLHCCSNWLLGGCDMMTALSLSLFNQTGRCFATTGISLFIIRHSIIMRRWSWFVDKQLKSDAERPSPININELHRIHRNVLNINLCSNQPKFTLSLSWAIRYVCIEYSFLVFVSANQTFAVIENAQTHYDIVCLTLPWG